MTTTATVPHLAFPFRFENGSAAVVEQDTVEDVAQCVELIVRTTYGSRIELPEFGVTDQTFRTTVDRHALLAQIERWEPRASALVSDAPSVVDVLLREAEIRVAVRS